jgi:endonuclease/exonuclease/phosphatase family metal-dependent hydrolase
LHLDHIYIDHQLKIQSARFYRNRRSLMASDHLPLVADLTIDESRDMDSSTEHDHALRERG